MIENDSIRQAVGALAAALAVVASLPYLRDMFRRKTHPHAFTWLIWGSLTGIGFFAQVAAGGGPGAWATGFSSLCCLVIVVFALFVGERDITRSDWFSLIGAVGAGLAWWITDDPLSSIVLICIIDGIAYVPTFRKSYWKPDKETASMYVIAMPKHAFSLVALDDFNLTTSLYPLTIIALNGAFLLFLRERRRAVSSNSLTRAPSD